jgi:hypothetical protein
VAQRVPPPGRYPVVEPEDGRIAARAGDAAQGHGVVVNPEQSRTVTFASGDRIIVLAESRARPPRARLRSPGEGGAGA